MALKLIPENTNIPFMKARYAAAVVSSLFVILTIVLLFTKGLNFGIDFVGGNLVQVQTVQSAQVSTLRTSLENTPLSGATIQQYGTDNEFLIRTPYKENLNPEELQNIIITALEDSVGQAEIRRVEFVGPQVGEELRKAGLVAILCALGAILLYISMRFEMRYGVGAVVALMHDVLLTVGIFSLLQKEVSLTVLAALLTVVGYSLNDTIVVFDRIREMRINFPNKPLSMVMNMALNQTLTRTLMTSFTTIVVLLALYFLGGSVINNFAFALLFGVFVGTYSSIFIASPVLLLFENYYQKIYSERSKEEQDRS